MTIPSTQEALFRRMAELLTRLAVLHFDAGERALLINDWYEIAPTVEYVLKQMDSVVAEDLTTITVREEGDAS